MKVIPLHDWAVIVPSEAPTRTAGGLYIPDSAKERPEEGIVESIGPGALEQEKHGKNKDESKERKFIPTAVKPGDRVLYEKWAGQTYTIGTEEKILVRERNILGLIDRPLQIPAHTSRQATAIAERPVTAVQKSSGQEMMATSLKTKTKKKAAKSSAKKETKKTTGPTPKKAPRKNTAKPATKSSKSGPSKGAKGKKAGKKK
jgi:chaperonin GroES